MTDSIGVSVGTNLRRESFIFDIPNLNVILADISARSEVVKKWSVFHFSGTLDMVCYDSTQDVSAKVVASGISGPMEMLHVSELSREERVKIARRAFGMWADREDFGDTADYVAHLRASWERAAEGPEVD